MDATSLLTITGPSSYDEVHKLRDNQTIEYVDRRPLDELINETMKQEESKPTIFKKFILPCSEARKGRKILNRFGYDSAKIFPGYGGVARELLTKREIHEL